MPPAPRFRGSVRRLLPPRRCLLRVAARHAASLVATLAGRRPESVISIERKDEEWRIGVEVVEVSRIPDSADILAVYDVRLDPDGDLISYRRVRRYARGQMDCERHR